MKIEKRIALIERERFTQPSDPTRNATRINRQYAEITKEMKTLKFCKPVHDFLLVTSLLVTAVALKVLWVPVAAVCIAASAIWSFEQFSKPEERALHLERLYNSSKNLAPTDI
jgi:hypothetical protein